MMGRITTIPASAGEMPLAVRRDEKVKPWQRKLRVFIDANGRLLMSCNSRLFKSHLVVRGDSGPCCKVDFY